VIYYGKQSVSQDDIDAVVAVLKSDLITQGPVATQFENAISDYVGVKFSLACSNGSAALHLACLAVNVGEGDVVWTVPNTFVASANCALYCGAQVDFVDIDALTLNISIPELSKKLAWAKEQNCLPKTLVVVHFAGNSCDMSAIKALSDEYGFFVIEDACHALGSEFRDKKVGCCEFSDISVFSFHPVKSITCGEGGMLLSNNKTLIDKARLLANNGITKDETQFENQNEGQWYYEQVELGFNYRITDIQCALGLSQLRRLDEFVASRHRIASRYVKEFESLPLQLQQINLECFSSFHLFTVTLKTECSLTKKQFFLLLEEKGIIANCHYIPVHLQPLYGKQFSSSKGFPVAEAYYRQSLSLPIYPSLTYEEQTKVIKAVKSCFA